MVTLVLTNDKGQEFGITLKPGVPFVPQPGALLQLEVGPDLVYQNVLDLIVILDGKQYIIKDFFDIYEPTAASGTAISYNGDLFYPTDFTSSLEAPGRVIQSVETRPLPLPALNNSDVPTSNERPNYSGQEQNIVNDILATAQGTLSVIAPPQANDDLYVTNQNTPILTAPLANDAHPTGLPFTITNIDDSGLVGVLTDQGNETYLYNPNGQFDYLPEGQVGITSYDYRISITTGASSTATVTIQVDGLNDAPVLSDANDFSPINENTLVNPGNTVGDIIMGHFADPDLGAMEGIAIIGTNTDNGVWQFSTNGGTTWFNIVGTTNNNALLLAGNPLDMNLIRFAPNANFNGESDITIRAWDQTSGANGTYVDVSVNGGTTAFSTATAVSDIIVNDTPVIGSFNVLDAMAYYDSVVFRLEASDINGNGYTEDNPADGTEVPLWTDKTANSNNATALGGGVRPDVSTMDNKKFIDFGDANRGLGMSSSNSINNASSYYEKTISVTFTTGANISGTQLVYEQGGSSRGYVMMMDAGELYAMIFNNTGEWGASTPYKSINLGSLDANITYTAVMVQNSNEVVGPDTGTFRGYLDGILIDTITDVPYQRAHGDPPGIGEINGSIRSAVAPYPNLSNTNPDVFEGKVSHLTSWNKAFTPTEIATNATAAESEAIPITNQLLQVQDLDNAPSEITYTVTGITNGQIEYINDSGNAITSFTQADVNAGLVAFAHDGSASTTAAFDFTFADPLSTPVAANINFAITSSIEGGGGDDLVVGTENADRIIGGAGTDELRGEIGADYLDGGAGNDQLFGGQGNDVLLFDIMDSIVSGGAGTNDVMLFTLNNAHLDITNLRQGGTTFSEIERITIGGNNQTLTLTSDIARDDMVDITDSNNILFVDGTGGNTVNLNLSTNWSAGVVQGDYTYYTDGNSNLYVNIGLTVDNTVNDSPVLNAIDVLEAMPYTDMGVFRQEAADIDGDGLVANNPSDGTQVTNWVDLTGNGNNAIPLGGGVRPVVNTDDGETFVDFSAANRGLKYNSSSRINQANFTEKTISVSFKTGNTVSGDQLVYEQGGGTRGYVFMIVDGELYAMVFNNSNQWGPTTADRYKSIAMGAVEANKSYTAVMVHDSTEGADGTFRAYLDGIEADTFLTDVPFQRSHGGGPGIGEINGNIRHPVTLATINNGNPDVFAGQISHMTSWNKAFSAAQIAASTTAAKDNAIPVATDLLSATDNNHAASELTYTLTGTTNGQVEYVDDPGVAIASFTQLDVDSGRVVFVHDGTNTTTATFDFDFADPITTVASETITLAVIDPITGTGAGETLVGKENADHIDSAGGDDTLLGQGGADYLDGGAGSDSLMGGAGSDILVFDDLDSIIDGGAGNNDILQINNDGATVDVTTLLNGGKTIENFERIHLVGDNQTLELTSDGVDNDIMDITDGNNELYIDGNNTDAVVLNLTGGGWGPGVDVGDYTSYTDGVSTLFVNNDIGSVTIL